MLIRACLYFEHPVAVVCDAKCNKAWGITGRPREQLSEDVDDFAYLSDVELGDAPRDPGTWEGGHGKPVRPEDRMNKWCVRECERSSMYPPAPGDRFDELVLKDFSKRRFNMPQRQDK